MPISILLFNQPPFYSSLMVNTYDATAAPCPASVISILQLPVVTTGGGGGDPFWSAVHTQEQTTKSPFLMQGFPSALVLTAVETMAKIPPKKLP